MHGDTWTLTKIDQNLTNCSRYMAWSSHESAAEEGGFLWIR